MSLLLNAEQTAAIAFTDDTWVSAGAGSGKTRALVELYIRSLEAAAAAERTVAITFTEKAASEMRERVRKSIDERLLTAAAAADKERWSSLRRDLPRAPIGTIHAFCAHLLRENPVAAVVDPAFVVMEERAATALLERTIERVVVGGVQDGNEAACALVETYGLQRAGLYGSDGVCEAVAGLYWQMNGAGMNAADCRSLLVEMADDGTVAAQMERLRAAMLALEQDVLDGSSKLRDEGRHVLSRWHALQSESSLVSFQRPQDGLRWLSRLQRVMRNRRSLQSREAWKEAREARERLTDALASALCAPLVEQVLDLLERVEREYRQAKDRLSGLDFDDLQVRARDLLRDFPGVRERYREAFDAIMVDEFQDVNPLQDQIVRLLSRKLFVVGDPKQSIYGFRGADVSVFTAMRERLALTHYLRSNYRSAPAVVDFVNDLFEAEVLSRERPTEHSWQVQFGEDDRMLAQRGAAEGSVSVLLMQRQQDELAEEVACREADLVADYLWNAVCGPQPLSVGALKDGQESPRPARFGDCAILFRVSTRMKVYAHELQRRGIPYYIVKGQGFFECQEIKDVVNVLLYLDCGDDAVALAGFLRSPMVALSDASLLTLARDRALGARFPHTEVGVDDAAECDALRHARAWLLEWRQLRDRLAPSELLERIIRSTGYLATIVGLFQGHQKVANVRKLVEMSRSYEEQGPYSFRSFVRWLVELIDEGAREPEYPVWAEKADVVRLMTVHQAKGLEFPLVVVPQMARENRSPPQCLLFSPQQGVVVKVRADRHDEWLRPAAFAAVEAEQKLRSDEEHRRLLYVAMTRAADHLVLSGEFGNREARAGTWAHWLRNYLGGAAMDDALRAAEPLLLRGAHLWTRAMVAAAPAASEPATPAIADVSVERVRQVADRIRGFVPPPATHLAVAARELAEYSVCARRAYYLSLLNLEEFPPRRQRADEDEEAPAQGMSALQAGVLIHRLLAEVPLDATTATVEALARRLEPGVDAAVVCGDLMAFLQGSTGQALRRARLVEREVPLQLSLRDADGWVLQVDGVADLIFCDQDGRWHVVDYKQSRRDRGKIPFYRYQLSIYALALAHHVGAAEVSAGLQFLKERGSDLQSFPIGAAESGRLQAELLCRGRELSVASQVAAEEAWPKVEPEQRCHDLGCGFRWRCGRLPQLSSPVSNLV